MQRRVQLTLALYFGNLTPDPLNSLIARISTMDQGSSLLSELRQQCGDFFYGFDQNQLVRQLDPRSIN